MNIHISRKLSESGPKLVLPVVLFLWLVIGFPVADTPESVLVKDAEAVLGRPASPTSVAGVSRRTTRRTVRRHQAMGHRVRALPSGCVEVLSGGVIYYRCSGLYYRPYYEGTEVVYIVVEEP